MDSNVVFKTNQGCIRHLSQLNGVFMESKGFMSHVEYKTLMENAYRLIIEKDLKYWISDLRNMRVITTENQKWTNEVFLPRVMKTTRIKKVAIIVGTNVFTAISMEIIKKELAKLNMPIKYFNSFEEAESWFKSISVAA